MNTEDSKIKLAIESFRKTLSGITGDDIKKAAEDGYLKVKSLGVNPPAPMVELWDDLKLMVGMIRDYYHGKYREVPWSSVAAIAAGLIYLSTPIDIIPDFIPVLGFLDDAAVIALVIKMVRKDLNRYRDWKLRAGEVGVEVIDISEE